MSRLFFGSLSSGKLSVANRRFFQGDFCILLYILPPALYSPTPLFPLSNVFFYLIRGAFLPREASLRFFLFCFIHFITKKFGRAIMGYSFFSLHYPSMSQLLPNSTLAFASAAVIFFNSFFTSACLSHYETWDWPSFLFRT